jgi:hypothetical protein
MISDQKAIEKRCADTFQRSPITDVNSRRECRRLNIIQLGVFGENDGVFILEIGPERQLNFETTSEQTERVTVNRVKIDDEAIALDVVRRAEKRFVFEIIRDNDLIATCSSFSETDCFSAFTVC